MVDQDRPAGHAGKSAVVTVDHAAQLVVVADAGEDDFGAFGRLGRRRRGLTLVLGGPGLGLGGGAVADPDLVAARGQMPGHGETHVAEADECDFHGSMTL